MLKTEGRDWIESFRKKWIALYFAEIFALSVALAFILITIIAICVFFSFQIWHFILAFIFVFVSFLIYKPTWKISKTDVAKYLNSKFIQLEESADLFLKPKSDLSLLEHLQIEKIQERLPVEKSLSEAWKKMFFSLTFLGITLIGVYLMENYYWYQQVTALHFPISDEKNLTNEIILPGIENFQLQITPPAYTGKSIRSQRQFTIKAAIGAQVSWQIEMNVSVKKLRLIFNDKEVVNLQKTDDLNWRFSKIINQSGFYQIEFDGKKSDLYQIEVIPDLPVSIKITQPKQHTTIDIGQLPKVNLKVLLSDDYGITDAYISATMSSGKGEGVSFTEKKLTFNTDFKNNKELRLSKLLDLKSLGMKPGDELYFFINAKDNHGQLSRSDVYLVSIVDTTELMSLAGVANGVDLVPEYFRSQRQIIIDTEKLLREQASLSADEFKNRSNTLGMDQKLLRLRYGKFLGEESETGVGGEHGHDGEDHPADEKFGDVQALMDEYAHKHDIAEDATFFEPEMKLQLKAVLNEMWSSELRLRTYKPQEALPFEYKALRLLKDLQQKSRAYVAKTTIKKVKLKQEKRLSGELDKINQPSLNLTFEQKDQTIADLKVLLAVLENRKTGKLFNYGDRELLRAGEGQFILAAANQPSLYLTALKSLREISTANKMVIKDINLVQKAIQKLIGVESFKPQADVTSSAANLYRGYFNRLKKMGN